MTTILWVDPGGTMTPGSQKGGHTGLAWISPGRDDFRWAEGNLLEMGARLIAIASACGPGLSLGYEQFTIFPDTHKKSAEAHWAIEMTGVTRLMALWGARLLPPAQPADRLVATPAILKALGWYPAGHKDAIAASQHLCAYMLKHRLLTGAQRATVASAAGSGSGE